jgi:O-antigen ligase
VIQKQEKSWWLQWDRWPLVAFIIGSGVLSGANQQRMVGLVLVASAFLSYFVAKRKQWIAVRGVPPELVCYTLWALWVGVSGIFVAKHLQLFWLSYRVLIQMTAMIWAVYLLLRVRMTHRLIYWSFVIVAMIQGWSAIMGVDLIGGSSLADAGAVLEDERIAGIAHNPNILGASMILSVGCAMALYRLKTLFVMPKMALFLLYVAVAGYIIVATGSRKSLLVIAVVLGLWAIWAMPFNRRSSLIVRLIAIIMLVVGYIVLTPLIMENTLMGQRFSQFMEEGQGRLSWAMENNSRYSMYTFGLRLFLQHPIAGVGLGHFVVYFPTGHYSHSDYIEPLACTGAIGFLLYQSFYVILLRRISRLLRMIREPQERYLLKVMAIVISGILLLGIGGPHWNSQAIFIMLTTFATYTWLREQQLKLLTRPYMP